MVVEELRTSNTSVGSSGSVSINNSSQEKDIELVTMTTPRDQDQGVDTSVSPLIDSDASKLTPNIDKTEPHAHSLEVKEHKSEVDDQTVENENNVDKSGDQTAADQENKANSDGLTDTVTSSYDSSLEVTVHAKDPANSGSVSPVASGLGLENEANIKALYKREADGDVPKEDSADKTVNDRKPGEEIDEEESANTTKNRDLYEEEMENEMYSGIGDYIPKQYWNTPLTCFQYGTITDISYRLDALDDAVDGSFPKDFTGLCDRLKLDPAFTKYLVKSHIKLKTDEVLCKWDVLPPGDGPRPTVGNFAKIVYYDLDRPDVIYDLQAKIVDDAKKWEETKREAKTDAPEDEDNSWQLTRHDVATGKKTFYTCCLCYADEDEGMATLITNFFQAVCKGTTRFFRPQFDLKIGRYCCDTTAKVIEDRCNGKVIFILSDYFYANPVCQFAVNFAHSRNPTADQGNLIPFYLSNKYEIAPKVLKGIAGIRWARKQFRYHSWGQLSDCLMVNSEQSELQEIQDRIKVELENSSSTWLCDPPYDESTPPPGPALPLNEPPESSVNSSVTFNPESDDRSPIIENKNANKNIRTRIAQGLRRLFTRNTNTQSSRHRRYRPEELNQAFEEEREPAPSVV